MEVTLENASDTDVTFTPVAAVPVYGRSADNVRDHKHVTSLLHRTLVTKWGLQVTPTLTFDERGHKKNTLTYYVYGSQEQGAGPAYVCPRIMDFIGEGGSLTAPKSLLALYGEKEEQLAVWKIFTNPVFAPGITAWFVAQLLKVILTWFSSKKMDMSRFVGSGGMPSSHSSLVMAVTTAIGIRQGFDSYLFGLALTFAMVVMYDAAGVRRAAGKQAAILNKLVENFGKEKPEVTGERLKELLGHSPLEVFAGAILGVIIGFIVHYL
jgi:acid phosphatase family membrane protein YuiD